MVGQVSRAEYGYRNGEWDKRKGDGEGREV